MSSWSELFDTGSGSGSDGDGADVEPPEQVGPFRIIDRLGGGGMGEVYRAYDEDEKRTVALKHVRVDAPRSLRLRERFLREARLIAHLEHPVIIDIHELREEDSGDWIVMELVEGETLSALLRRDGAFGEAKAAWVGAEIASALAVAHAAEVVHRDLKLANVMLTRLGEVRVLDFGIARWHTDPEAPDLTATGQVLGTPEAMSPEQAMGLEIDGRSDLFSLGSLLYELVSGSSPFRAARPLQTVRRICTGTHVPLGVVAPTVSLELSDLVDRLLEKDSESRPASAAEVEEELRRIADAAERETPTGSRPRGAETDDASGAETEVVPALRRPERDAES